MTSRPALHTFLSEGIVVVGGQRGSSEGKRAEMHLPFLGVIVVGSSTATGRDRCGDGPAVMSRPALRIFLSDGTIVAGGDVAS